MTKTSDNQPLISVVMPVYNAELYLREAIDSILNQTYTNFELIAVNDGSKDSSLEILKRYQAADPRIVIIDQENKGLVSTLNSAIKTAKGDYIARMDADDVSLPRRFEWQIEVFQANPQAVLVAGCFEVMNEFSEFDHLDAIPSKDSDIKRILHLYNPLAHGSVMFKKATFEKLGGYRGDVGPTEDFELWCRMAHEGEFVGIAHAIFRWRMNPTGITHTKNELMVEKTREYIRGMWQDFPLDVISSGILRKHTMWYVQEYGHRGVRIKQIMLENNAHIAIKLISHGEYLKGLCQFLAVALVGRSGLRACWERLKIVLRWIVFRR